MTHLYLSKNNIGDSGAVDLAERPRRVPLLHMDLSANDIEDEGGLALASMASKHMTL